MTNPRMVAGAVAAAVVAACAVLTAQPQPAAPDGSTEKRVVKNREELKKKLTPEQYHIVCERGTEPPFRNAYWDNKKDGEYRCVACGALLFDSKAKFDSGTGWPSFWQPAASNAVAEAHDASHGMERVETLCANCGAHLGHVFPDGPRPTGLRYCINSASLDFQPREGTNSAAAKH